ncbi:hypothetical protein [Streptomyces sp. NPDC058247]|uniref:hypothetical protein n=1 Tax=Streptomyces sp. NPDC058247 TaxID=3346401 RepID=UPI0036EBEDA5
MSAEQRAGRGGRVAVTGPRDPPREAAESGFRQIARRVDLFGIIGFAITMISLVVFLMALPHITCPRPHRTGTQRWKPALQAFDSAFDSQLPVGHRKFTPPELHRRRD